MVISQQTSRWQALRRRTRIIVAVTLGTLTAALAITPTPVAGQTSISATQFSTMTASICGKYIVKPGDWLSAIGSRYGISWRTLAQLNELTHPTVIYPGQQLSLCAPNGPPAPRPVALVAPAEAAQGVVAQANAINHPAPPVHSAPVATNQTVHQAAPVQSHAAVQQPPVQHAPPTTPVMSSYNGGEFCHSSQFVAGPISQWTVPPGCYAGVYRPNPANYVARSGFGWCNWWPEVLHPNNPGILFGARSSTPAPGAVAVFAPGDQGAGGAGHYGEVVAVLGNGWILISEMNNTWRGAGFGLVNYRYVRLDGGVSFIYG